MKKEVKLQYISSTAYICPHLLHIPVKMRESCTYFDFCFYLKKIKNKDDNWINNNVDFLKCITSRCYYENHHNEYM